jgi:hypothetical protein
MTRFAVRFHIALWWIGVVHAADPIGIVANIENTWTQDGQMVHAGMLIVQDNPFVPSGTGDHSISLIRYSDGKLLTSACRANTCASFYLGAVTTKPPDSGLWVRVANYVGGGAKLPTVYAQSRGMTIPDDALMVDSVILEQTGRAVDFAKVFRKPPPTGVSLLVQNATGESVSILHPAESLLASLPGDGRGVYALRALDRTDGIIASSIVLIAPAASVPKARQMMSGVYETIDNWNKQSPVDPAARLTLLLNAMMAVYGRL